MAAKQCKKPNGICTIAGDDKLPVQCVGEWAKDKHDILSRYLEGSAGPRAGYVTTKKTARPGGAAYVDLFAGPGRARVRESGTFISGSPLLALQHTAAPFTKVILCEKDEESLDALRQRTSTYASADIVEGDCNEEIDDVIARVPEYGLNIALIDPYGLRPLSFQTLSKLASIKRMDLIIHFPMMDMKRNLKLESYTEFFANFLGTDDWSADVKSPADIARLIPVLKGQLAKFGYKQEQVLSVPIKNSKNNVIYYLVYASKHDKGNAIWQSIAKNLAGQTGWGF